MHDASVTPAAEAARRGGAAALAAALQASRADTLATFAACAQALPDLAVAAQVELNPPLWELGHIGWFQEFWIARNPLRARGAAADPDWPRTAPLRAEADALYDSSTVPHHTRGALPLPDADQTRSDLARQLEGTLTLLHAAAAAGDPGDDALYFFRLALLHEDMHHEAALYMAQSLGIACADARWQAAELPLPPAALASHAGPWRLGYPLHRGFAFDNERPVHHIDLGSTAIDAQAVRWAEYLPFVEAGGYFDDRWWSTTGRAWRNAQRADAPRYLRRTDHGWQCWRHGRWRALAPAEAASHLTRHEAEAWCRWAGRRLPSEAEWERAAITHAEAFRWGDVWEWTSSPFEPFPGFVAHPYRDYSAPWFHSRAVLRGASRMTQPRMHDAHYRNFFPPERNDLAAGFRSCAP